MIVNPQLFNYRLIIGSLLVVLTVLGIFSFSNYKSIESYEEFLKQEKSLIEIELSDLLLSYDKLSEDSDIIGSQLAEAKLETQDALDSLRLLKSNLSVVNVFKKQLTDLKIKSALLLVKIDSLQTANLQLQQEKHSAIKTIKTKTNLISGLEQANEALNKTIDNASVLRASNVNAQAYRVKSGTKRFTDKAKRASAIDVCITLAENPLAENGKKDIYIQILSPAGNVISDQGEIKFDDESLNYSKKEVVNYTNKNLHICAAIIAEDKNKPLPKGLYFINVFHKNNKLGSTSITLN